LTTYQRIDLREEEGIGLNRLVFALSSYLDKLEIQELVEGKGAEREVHEAEKRKTTQKIKVLANYDYSDPIGIVVIAPEDPIHIAYMLTVSGGTAFLGEDSKGAIEIAIDDRGGQLLGHEIKLTGEDTGCSAQGGLNAAIKIVADPSVLGVIGTNCASAATAAIPTISSAGMVILSPSNTAPALTLQGETWRPGYYRLCHTDLLQGSIAAKFAYNELKSTKASTVHDGSPYSIQLQAVFANYFQRLGGTITSQRAIKVGDINMQTVLTKIAADTPDVLYLPIFEPEGPFVVAQSSEIMGLKKTILIGADSLLARSFPMNAGPNVIGMYLTDPYVSGVAYDKFLNKWKYKFGDIPPSNFHAFAYDGTNILLDAIKMVAVFDRDGTIYIGRQALRDVLNSISNFKGITGALGCKDRDYGALGIPNPSHGDFSSGEALGIFQITKAEIKGNWPPPVVYTRKDQPFDF
jgi:branched-chain amino acid transport system substrate-binding protein